MTDGAVGPVNNLDCRGAESAADTQAPTGRRLALELLTVEVPVPVVNEDIPLNVVADRTSQGERPSHRASDRSVRQLFGDRDASRHWGAVQKDRLNSPFKDARLFVHLHHCVVQTRRPHLSQKGKDFRCLWRCLLEAGPPGVDRRVGRRYIQDRDGVPVGTRLDSDGWVGLANFQLLGCLSENANHQVGRRVRTPMPRATEYGISV